MYRRDSSFVFFSEIQSPSRIAKMDSRLKIAGMTCFLSVGVGSSPNSSIGDPGVGKIVSDIDFQLDQPIQCRAEARASA